MEGFRKELAVIGNLKNVEMFEALHDRETIRQKICLSRDVLVDSDVLLKLKLCVTPHTSSPINH